MHFSLFFQLHFNQKRLVAIGKLVAQFWMLNHSSLHNWWSSFKWVGFLPFKIIPQIFNTIEVEDSGKPSLTLAVCLHYKISFDGCLGSLSCWNTHLCLSFK